MSQYTKIGEIALWPNKSKTGKQPDVTGTLQMDDGQKFSVSLWKREEGGNPDAPVYFGQISQKEGESAPPNSPARTGPTDEIPF